MTTRATALAFALALALAGCCVGGGGGLSGSDCDTVVQKIRVCDPSAAGAPDASLRLQCLGTRPQCVSMPVGSPAECGAFMGCLYGD